ncbi:hypothetical protein [Streptomyces sp. NPDC001307]|uniref:hypothetical protein n=1 Tax=Streptomyces sp. NPDC001307 TaxID=3364560 RepID=UPI0036A1D9DA
MHSRKTFLEALRALRDHEEVAEHGWVLLGMLRPDHHKAVESATGQGLVELADRKMHAELSVHVCRPLVRAARLTGHGQDVLTEASPAPRYQPEGPADQGVAGGASSLGHGRTARCTCTSVPGRMCRRAEDLAERARTARQLGALWPLYLTEEQIESVSNYQYLWIS